MNPVGPSQPADQMMLNFDGNETIEITLPPGCQLPTPVTGWTKYPDGKIIARYTRDELIAALGTIGWLDHGAEQLSLQGLTIYARLRIGEDLIAGADDGRRGKLIIHWCVLYSELAIAEPDLVGGGHGDTYWRQWTQEVIR